MDSKFCLEWRYKRKGLLTIKWSILCGSKVSGGLQITNVQWENNTYLLRLTWEFAYGKTTWTTLMCLRFLKFKYQKNMFFKSSSI